MMVVIVSVGSRFVGLGELRTVVEILLQFFFGHGLPLISRFVTHFLVSNQEKVEVPSGINEKKTHMVWFFFGLLGFSHSLTD